MGKTVVSVDGNSTVNTLEIQRANQDQLNWINELDHGLADTIKKSLKIISSELMAYLNSDEMCLIDMLYEVRGFSAENPKANRLSGIARL